MTSKACLPKLKHVAIFEDPSFRNKCEAMTQIARDTITAPLSCPGIIGSGCNEGGVNTESWSQILFCVRRQTTYAFWVYPWLRVPVCGITEVYGCYQWPRGSLTKSPAPPEAANQTN